MWFLGMVLGLLFGASVGGVWGALFGVIIGALAGALLGKLLKSGATEDNQTPGHAQTPTSARLDKLQRAVEDIHWRLKRLEDAQGLAGSPLQSEKDAAPQTTSSTLSGEASAATKNVAAAIEPSALTASTTPSAPAVNEVWGKDASVQDLDRAAKIEAELSAAANAVGASQKEVSDTSPLPAPPPPPLQPQAPRAPARPKEPATPNPIVAWFMGGNTIVRVGVVILFIGLAFLAKYAADAGMFPIEVRLAGVALAGVALLVVGWRLRKKAEREGYALTLQGAGVAVLYLTVFTAFRMQLLPAAITFPLLVGIAICSAILAMRQNAMSLAIIGAAGGFLAPILASTGGGSHVALFSYYLVLNVGILFVAWHKAWRPLNIVGFVFTFVIATAWGNKYYEPAFYASCQAFLIVFFLIYLCIALLYAFRQAPKLTDTVDGTLIFGVPIVAFGLQAGMVHHTEFGLAFSALALAAVYLGLATWLHATKREPLHLLMQSFQALGVIFASLAIPLALDARWTSAAWALEGAAIYWVGVRQGRKLARAFGLLMFALANVAFIHGWRPDVDALAVFNRDFLGALLLALSAFFLNRLIRNSVRKDAEAVTETERSIAPAFFVLGFAWWCIAAVGELDLRFTGYVFTLSLVVFASVTAFVFALLHKRLDWPEAAWPQRLLLPVLIALGLACLVQRGGFFLHYGWIVWPLALVMHYVLLSREQVDATTQKGMRAYLSLQHVTSFLFAGTILAWELHELVALQDLRATAWAYTSLIVVPLAMLAFISRRRAQDRWPMRDFPQAYLLQAATVIVAGLAAWSVLINIAHDGSSSPLPYLPLLNIIDIAHGFIIVMVLTWWRRAKTLLNDAQIESTNSAGRVVFGALGFLWANAILLRTIHQHADVPYQLDALMASTLVQASLSIFWTVLALVLIFIASRKGMRALWFVGATLLAIVVAKLFLVDFGGLGGLTRIISFVAVGVLMLVIGYVSPLPPALRNEAAKSNEAAKKSTTDTTSEESK